MDQANKLLSGKIHEDEDEDDEIDLKPGAASQVNFKDQTSKEKYDNKNELIKEALHIIF